MTKFTSKTASCLAALAVLSSVSLSAGATQIPVFDTFGPLPVATFGGMGIPNNAVAQTTFGVGGILGLTATARFSNPTVTNDGAGHFFAPTGIDQTDATSIAQQFARWNINFYVDKPFNTATAAYSYQFLFDVDHTAGEVFKSAGASLAPGVFQDSLNLGRTSLEVPFAYTFNPAIDGEYTFLLIANVGTRELARTSIVVQVGRGLTVPEPGTMALMALGLLGLVGLRRRTAKTS